MRLKIMISIAIFFFFSYRCVKYYIALRRQRRIVNYIRLLNQNSSDGNDDDEDEVIFEVNIDWHIK